MLALVLLAAAISHSLDSLVYFWSSLIAAFMPSSILASPLLSSLLYTYGLSILLLRYKALCFVMNFLLLWSICLRFFLVNFNNGSEYLTKQKFLLPSLVLRSFLLQRNKQVFIPLLRFLLPSLVLRSFLHQRNSFHTFSFISVCLFLFVSCLMAYQPSQII